MKRYIAAVAAALTVCLTGSTALALESYVEPYRPEDYEAARLEEKAITEAYSEAMRGMDPEEQDIETRIAIMTEAYEAAGWTVAREAPVAAGAGQDFLCYVLDYQGREITFCPTQSGSSAAEAVASGFMQAASLRP